MSKWVCIHKILSYFQFGSDGITIGIKWELVMLKKTYSEPKRLNQYYGIAV